MGGKDEPNNLAACLQNSFVRSGELIYSQTSTGQDPVVTPFFLFIVPVGKSPIGVVLWIGGVVRVNVATLNRVAVWISRTVTMRLDLTSGSSLGFRLRPHNRRDPKPRRECQTGNQKKRASRDA